MKKAVLILSFLALALMGYSQVTPGKTVRIDARTTVFGANLSVGTTIYCVADSTYWVVKLPCATTFNINTASAGVAKIMQLNAEGAKVVTENFELASSGTGEFVTLAFTALDSTAFRISLNGVELTHTASGQCWVAPLVDNKVHFRIPVYQYDVVAITYTK